MHTLPVSVDLRIFDNSRLTRVLSGSFLTPLLLVLTFLFLPDFHLTYHTGLLVVGGLVAVLVLALGVGIWWSIRRVRLTLLETELRLDWLNGRGESEKTLAATRSIVRSAAIIQGEKPEQYYLTLETTEANPIVLTLVSTSRQRADAETLLHNWLPAAG
ncbi:hypothetical protein [Hymenobacter rigui]|uniref:Uncharacterized protein n=1 Tax=Hymenobacter rigui TaxID=334424 RepID=A0A428KR81_9BACT|nr:hypothetical protein [Hymenobacter rigui]RSK48965.1 hypothetical protein EI291_10425 [Hymenobacter rigui]